MEWTSDVTAGDWLRERLEAAPWPKVVPPGFPAYARIFHPAERDRPLGRPWPPLPYDRHAREWEAFQSAQPDIDTERVRWAGAAAAFGTTMHELAQWDDLVERFREVEGEDGPRDRAGWRYHRPMWGQLAPDVLVTVAAHLATHTSTPTDAFIGVWEGWGGLVGALGYGPSRVLLTTDDDPRHGDFLAHTARDSFNDVFRKPEWQTGILPDDVSRGPRLELPDRAHVLFRGGVAELADPDWPLRMPWTDAHSAAAGLPSAESPSLVWPADNAWVLVSEVDYDSTVVAGSAELVQALCADGRIEALPLPAGADLSSDGDEVNR